ncbi:hypothetical protein QBK99_12605 [Corticibacterium sp. UT-5YL-CI-8]|nr:hypothetical protein [Tianweitania sp. UT-5YL-CI-8]
MTDIPEDIMVKAASVCASVGITDSHSRKVLAAAILAERKRCANVARAYLEDLAGCSLRDDEPERIAAKIEANS